MVLPVRSRIHWGMGRFCFIFLERIFLILKVLCEGCHPHGQSMPARQYPIPRARARPNQR